MSCCHHCCQWYQHNCWHTTHHSAVAWMSIVHVTWPSRSLYNKNLKKEAQDVCFVLGFLLKELITVWPSNSFFAVNLSGQASCIPYFFEKCHILFGFGFSLNVSQVYNCQFSGVVIYKGLVYIGYCCFDAHR